MDAQIITDSAFVHQIILNGIDNSNYIFEAEVLTKQSYYNQNHDFIYTSNTVQVNQVWKQDDQKSIR